jgi:ribosomal protein S18 acetylase RimI-like enzyme
MCQVSPIPAAEPGILRRLRLDALRDSPDAFLHTLKQEESYGEADWAAEFTRGHWYAGFHRGTPVGLLGTTREDGMPSHECYLEFMWVHPDHRRTGMALRMLHEVLRRLRLAGVRTAFLWIMDSNSAAEALYKGIGFVGTGIVESLPDGRTEAQLRLDLARPPD